MPISYVPAETAIVDLMLGVMAEPVSQSLLVL